MKVIHTYWLCTPVVTRNIMSNTWYLVTIVHRADENQEKYIVIIYDWEKQLSGGKNQE